MKACFLGGQQRSRNGLQTWLVVRGTRRPRESHSHSRLRLRLRLEHERLSQRFLQNRPTVVHGVQKPEQLATQLPILVRHRATQQPEGVLVTRVELFETVQDEEVRARRSQALRAQASLCKF